MRALTYNLYLDSKPNRFGKVKIYCYVRGFSGMGSKPIMVQSQFRTNPDLWNSKKQRTNEKATAIELNSQLDLFLKDVENAVNQKLLDTPDADYWDIKAGVAEYFREKEPVDFFTVYDKFVGSKEILLTPATKKKYQTLRNHLEKFEKILKIKLTLRMIDDEFISNLRNYFLSNLGMNNNSTYRTIGVFQTFLIWLNKKKYSDYDFKIKDTGVEQNSIDIIYLTELELMQLYDFDLTTNKRLNDIRDVFCFQCWTGARYSDIIKFNSADVKDDTWHLRTTKTKDPLHIPLNQYARAILNKRNGKLPARLSNQKQNDALKELCKIVGINELITIADYKGSERIDLTKNKYELISTHTARRTFITLCLDKGMDVSTIMKITGHTKYEVFKRYLAITDKKTKTELNRIWD